METNFSGLSHARVKTMILKLPCHYGCDNFVFIILRLSQYIQKYNRYKIINEILSCFGLFWNAVCISHSTSSSFGQATFQGLNRPMRLSGYLNGQGSFSIQPQGKILSKSLKFETCCLMTQKAYCLRSHTLSSHHICAVTFF